MREVDKAALGRRILKRRTALGMSQRALGDACGMSQQGIGNLEDAIVARPRGLIELAQALNTTEKWLLWQEGPETLKPDKALDEQISTAVEALDLDQLPAVLMFIKRLKRAKKPKRKSG